MDKILAMSLLSAGPGFTGAEGWLSHFIADDRPRKREKEVKDDNKKREISRNEPVMASSIAREKRPHFALEFDGLNCFETIVSH